MSTDFAEKEREFLTTLKADTGRDLDEWMAAIGAQSLNHRNDIIDWLREQGFLFARASWLERIHHNGGRPIYWDGTAPDAQVSPTPVTQQPAVAASAQYDTTAAPKRAAQPGVGTNTHAKIDFSELDVVLSKAKAYRPLAQFLIEKIYVAVPASRFRAHGGYISITHDREYAILQPNARGVRLGLALGEHPFNATITKARFSGPGLRVSSAITHMVVLDDARAVDNGLMALIRTAYSRNNA